MCCRRSKDWRWLSRHYWPLRTLEPMRGSLPLNCFARCFCRCFDQTDSGCRTSSGCRWHCWCSCCCFGPRYWCSCCCFDQHCSCWRSCCCPGLSCYCCCLMSSGSLWNTHWPQDPGSKFEWRLPLQIECCSEQYQPYCLLLDSPLPDLRYQKQQR